MILCLCCPVWSKDKKKDLKRLKSDRFFENRIERSARGTMKRTPGTLRVANTVRFQKRVRKESVVNKIVDTQVGSTNLREQRY